MKEVQAGVAHDFLQAAEQGDLQQVKAFLSQNGALVFSKGYEDCTALHFAASRGRTDIAALLIATKADVTAKDEGGKTPLHKAIYGGADMVKLLLRHGADVHARDNRGNTPLHEVAIEGQHPELAELLLANNPDVIDLTNLNNRGRTPLDVAREYEHAQAVARFLEGYSRHPERRAGSRLTAAINTAKQGQSFRVANMLKKLTRDDFEDFFARNGDVNEILIPEYGYTVLHMAVDSGKLDNVLVVLARKPLLEIKSREQGHTPLAEAVVEDQVEIAAALLDAGADIEATADVRGGLRPIHLAAMRGRPNVLTVLIQRGADVHSVEINGATALHGAAFNGFTEVTRILLCAGADPQKADNHGNTPLALARRNGRTTVVALIEEASNSNKSLLKRLLGERLWSGKPKG